MDKHYTAIRPITKKNKLSDIQYNKHLKIFGESGKHERQFWPRTNTSNNRIESSEQNKKKSSKKIEEPINQHISDLGMVGEGGQNRECGRRLPGGRSLPYGRLPRYGADPWRRQAGRSPGCGGRRPQALAAMPRPGPGRDALALFYGGRGEATWGIVGRRKG